MVIWGMVYDPFFSQIIIYYIMIYIRYLQHPKGIFLQGFAKLQKYLMICRKRILMDGAGMV